MSGRGLRTKGRGPTSQAAIAEAFSLSSEKKKDLLAPGLEVLLSNWSDSTSLAAELRLPLLVVGGETLDRVLALEEQLLQLALEGQAALERDLPSRLHGALDAADGLGRLVGRAEAA